MSSLSKTTRKFNIGGGRLDPVHRLDVWTLPSMQAAVATMAKRLVYMPERGWRKEVMDAIPGEAMGGNTDRLRAAQADSDNLIAEAILADPRLARRSQWLRGEEGEVVCPALLSQGDDAPCFYRTRAIVGQPNGAEPVRIVISTDGNTVPERTAAAFIATVRLVQQYRPIEVFWQGSWLTEARTAGWVFHVPLVSGDMDFSRLEFCIASNRRDNLSWAVMMTRACDETRSSWSGCNTQATRSYLPGAEFVSHHGIDPTGESVAYHAAQWLGWESMFEAKWNVERSVEGALQHLPEPTRDSPLVTQEQRARWKAESERYESERKQRESEAAKARAAALNYNYS